ncbi:hypothetical protein B0T26DRAFT_227474 [Lasiosphaeria miniovina]|uniref:ADF-H domain-containing protein n=1 Tax=Lasiosphaeria miniovina TaxID=1954250 RepID=A0AA40E2I2_9PEZI|nr:uncharacterized protein B0T26DRAFT_227474 [Lasiosphaeria miniovina]KAK0722587.1 hypothetical protein B0T26DRAFT_227474 [Lasiosphaeria miniovina]
MSLNGLDGASVREAHAAAVAEAGGWFLLKYVSRDEIELLDRGSGGIVEIRNSISQYNETSPLFGFLRYRRRNVLIKYMPEDCSRLVQARVTVHFNAVCERFSPYDTDFEITNAKELKDTKLSAACSLHAASNSTSSSTSSLRRRRLMEITEEEEEEERERKRQSIVKEDGGLRPADGHQDSTTTSTSPIILASEPPVRLNADLANLPEASRFTDGVDPPSFLGVPRPSSPAKSFDEATRRMSSQSSRPDLYSYPHGKSRVKLAPRPSADISGRPRTSAGSAVYRPVSTIPAGLKSSLAKGTKKSRSQDNDNDEDGAESLIEEEPESGFEPTSKRSAEATPLNIIELTRPHTSSGAQAAVTSSHPFKSILPTLPPPPNKQNGMTPEKARLLKAMKLREKKKMLGLQKSPDQQSVEESSEPGTPDLPEEDAKLDASTTVKAEDVPVESERHVPSRLSAFKADSGIDVGPDHASVDTHMDSHPTSPFAASDMGDSTKASSLSESTDETVLAAKEQDLPLWTNDDHEDPVLSPVPRDDGEPATEFAARNESESYDREPGVPASKEVEDEELKEQRREKESDSTEELDEEADNTDPVGEDLIEALVEAPVEIPVESPVEAPAEAAFEAPVEIPVDAPVEASVEAAAEAAVEISDKTPDKALPETVVTGDVSPAHVLPVSKFSSAALAPSPMDKGVGRSTNTETAASPVTPVGTVQSNSAELSEETSRPLRLRIPVSKFSAHETKSPISPATRTIPSIITHVSRDDHAVGAQTEAIRNKEETEIGDAVETASIETRRSKRALALEPIRTDLDALEKDKRHSEISLFDDDGLMEELQSATVQQAKPIMVSKSPITPFIPSDSRKSPAGLDSGSTTPRFVRTVSNPIRGPLLTPGDVSTSSARAVSSGAAYLHKITQQQATDLRPKSSKIGSSISQRIKALEKLSGSSTVGDTPVKERPASTFFSVRKTSGREPSRSPSVVDRANSLTRGTTPSPPESRESSPETGKKTPRDRSGSLVNRLSMFEGGKMPRGRPESIQVTARIVRDPNQPFPRVPESKADATTEYGQLDLKQSPLVVDVKKKVPFPSLKSNFSHVSAKTSPEQDVQLERKPSLLQRRFSKGRRSQSQDRNKEASKEEDKQETETLRPRRRSSLTVVKDFIKDRRESLLGAKSPSTDNLNLNLSSTSANLGSPALPTPSRSPSRPPSVHQSLSFPRRLSISSRRSSIEQSSPLVSTNNLLNGAMSPSRTTEASGESETDGKSTNGADRRAGSSSSGSNPGSAATSPTPGKSATSSRTSRFIRRLSSSLGSGRKNIPPSISPTVAEEEDADVEAAGMIAPHSRGGTSAGATTHHQPSIVAFMGDVNVQFPDNLLWKRRTICLDSQGFLILSAVQGAAALTTSAPGKDRHHQAGVIKRYHMSDFRLPYTPEMEVQELPNSVVLDFVDGSGLQIACEDRAGQMNVLQILQEAHQNHTSFGL